ncbi:MAG: hypothetical protein ACRBBN_02535 [Methyloligellaceae bacterium]
MTENMDKLILTISRLLILPERKVKTLMKDNRAALRLKLHKALYMERIKGEKQNWSYNFYKHRTLCKIYREGL